MRISVMYNCNARWPHRSVRVVQRSKAIQIYSNCYLSIKMGCQGAIIAFYNSAGPVTQYTAFILQMTSWERFFFQMQNKLWQKQEQTSSQEVSQKLQKSCWALWLFPLTCSYINWWLRCSQKIPGCSTRLTHNPLRSCSHISQDSAKAQRRQTQL